MFPALRGCIQFLNDFLVDDASGHYLIAKPHLPSVDTFVAGNTSAAVLCEGTTIDIQIVDAVFGAFVNIVGELGVMDELLPIVQAKQMRLPPMTIDSSGHLREWPKDHGGHEPGHRHLSHLWGLYPGNSITRSTTPDLAAASAVVLRQSAEHGGGHTAWSRAWLINLHARLADAEGCLEHLHRLLKESILPNMLDNHPPLQIDGNLGGMAGILEMLIQSHEGYIQLLPACPKSWTEGSLSGVRARGGFEVDFEWSDCKIKEPVAVHSTAGNAGKLVFPCGASVTFEGPGTHFLYKNESYNS